MMSEPIDTQKAIDDAVEALKLAARDLRDAELERQRRLVVYQQALQVFNRAVAPE